MKLYTPADIAKFVACHDLGDANEREIINALKQWDKDPMHGALAVREQDSQLASPDARRLL